MYCWLLLGALQQAARGGKDVEAVLLASHLLAVGGTNSRLFCFFVPPWPGVNCAVKCRQGPSSSSADNAGIAIFASIFSSCCCFSTPDGLVKTAMAPLLLRQCDARLVVVIVLLGLGAVEAQFFVGFYNQNCPTAESVVNAAVLKFAKQDPTLPASLLRLHFHDCFVQGCDGSLLLDSISGFPIAEKDATPNLSIRGYEVIDAAKEALEAACPGVVSCADIVALAARDSVVVSGGPTWQVPTGRRDGRISLNPDALLNLPPATANVQQLTQSFASKGLTQDEMITLSGAHTIGRAHCSSFSNRLYNFNLTSPTDSSLDPTYAAQLKQMCPPNASPNTLVPLDMTTPLKFDNNYYSNLVANRGLMTSDQILHNDLLTQFTATFNSQNDQFWSLKFTNAMIRLSSIAIKVGTVGEIRKNCRIRN